MIIGTYLAFNVTSDILYQMRTYGVNDGPCSSCEQIGYIASLLQIVGYLSDAILYIALQPQVKEFFKKRSPLCDRL